jgi:hypothetical protein
MTTRGNIKTGRPARLIELLPRSVSSREGTLSTLIKKAGKIPVRLKVAYSSESANHIRRMLGCASIGKSSLY